MTPLDRLPPVLLMGGISLVRTLGQAGIPAFVAASDPAEPALASRHCARAFVIPRLDSGEAAADALVAIGEDLRCEYGRRVPLMYGSDDALGLVNAHRERFARYFLLLLNDREVASALIAKDRFQAFARERGLPVPQALAWDGTGRASLQAATGEVVVKPSEKIDWHDSALCRQLFGGEGKARIFASGALAREHPVVAAHRRSLTFQEYVSGGTDELWSYHGFADERGEVLAEFTGRKLRAYPAVVGESAFIEIAHDDGLLEAGRDAARRCPLKGFFKIDFKRDPRSGRWYLLEVNARCSLWLDLAACNGLNLMAVAYEYLLAGRRPAAVRAGTRYRWLALGLDVQAYREMARNGELSLGGWLASLAASRNVHNLFRWSDPLPWIAHWRLRLARRLGRGPGRLASIYRQWRATAS